MRSASWSASSTSSRRSPRERREIADQRSDASRQLRSADEQLGHSGRALSDTETELAHQQASLQDLQQRRDDPAVDAGVRNAANSPACCAPPIPCAVRRP